MAASSSKYICFQSTCSTFLFLIYYTLEVRGPPNPDLEALHASSLDLVLHTVMCTEKMNCSWKFPVLVDAGCLYNHPCRSLFNLFLRLDFKILSRELLLERLEIGIFLVYMDLLIHLTWHKGLKWGVRVGGIPNFNFNASSVS